MPTPTEHSVLGPSSSSRWLHCTASPAFESQFPDKSSTVYASEGTLAHRINELTAGKHFKKLSPQKYAAEMKKCKANELYSDEMLETAQFYVEYLTEKYNAFTAEPYIQFEVPVRFEQYVPDGRGTCDCVMIGGDRMQITDYKHGKGVKVESVGNTQMRLYALGAYLTFQLIYGDSIKSITMAIVQPRITSEITEDTISTAELLDWAENYVKPRAHAAATGEGAHFAPGDWCKFCRGRAQCRERADHFTAFEDFKDCLIQNRDDWLIGDKVLSDDDVGDLLYRAAGLAAWYKDLQDYAQSALLEGRPVKGWKMVEGRSIRSFTDADAAFKTLTANGWDEAMLYERKAKSLAELEKMVGKKQFGELCGDYIQKPPGKPTMVSETDKRPAYNPAAADFAGVGNN